MTMLAIVGLIVLFALMLLKMPISICMLIVGFFGVWAAASPNAAYILLSADLWNNFSSYSLSVIPLYVLMGEIVFRSGITDKMFHAAYKWVGQFRGGMLSTVILASAGFASICGSNSATAATMGTIALPELKKYRYNETLSTGSIAGGGTLGVIIPPSTVLLVIAIQTQQSIKELFVASIVPGLLLTLLFLATVIFLCTWKPEWGPAGPKSSFREKIVSLGGTLPVFLLFVFVIGGLFLGWFTPTESGAVGTAGAMLIALAMRKLTLANLKAAVFSTIRTSAMIVMLVVGAMVFGRFLTITRLPFEVAEWATSLPLPPFMVLVFILIVYTIGGALMDALGFLLISIPLFFPALVELGYHPVWVSVVLCIVTSMGAITPPVGVNVFIVQGLNPSISTMKIFKGASLFLLAYVICIILLALFPQLVLWPV